MSDGIAIAGRPLTFARPARQTDDDGATSKLRLNGYGEQYVRPTGDRYDAPLDEGSVFVTTNYGNQTPGTGVALGAAAQTAFNETACAMAICNAAQAGQNAPRLRLDYLKLLCTVANTAGTEFNVVLTLDKTDARLPAGQVTAVNTLKTDPLGASGTLQANAKIYAGALALNAATGTRKFVGRARIKSAILSVGDELLLQFNGADAKTSSGTTNATAPTNYTRAFAPIVIEPGWALFVHVYAAAQTGAPSFEVEALHIER